MPNAEAQVMHRIVACQGSAQLATAIAAMRTLDEESDAPVFRDHLIIHDLAAPGDQISEFVDCIRYLAGAVQAWASVTYLPGDGIADSLAGLPSASQLIVGQNNTELSRILRITFPDAKKVCYGDGIGLNFTNGYYDPHLFNSASNEFPPASQWMRLLNRFRSQKNEPATTGRPCSETAAGFDCHYLLLANRFDQHLSNYHAIQDRQFVELFATFGKHIKHLAPKTHEVLRGMQSRRGKLVVLLTSNFSETERLSIDDEVDGCLEMLSHCPQGSDVQLFLKPHPRDSHEKLMRLSQAVHGVYQNVVALSDPRAFYVPFESIYCEYLSPVWGQSDGLNIATVSSACISLELLFQQECVQGFGRQFVTERFVPLWAPLRIKHEEDLLRIVKEIRCRDFLTHRAA